MPSAFLRSKVDERAALTDLVSGILDKCSDEQRDPSQEERAKLDDYSNRIKVLDGSIMELRTAEEANARFLQTAARLEDADERQEQRQTGKPAKATAPVSLGQAFVESEQFKSYRGRGTMDPVEFQDFLGIEQRAAITLDTLNLPDQRIDGPAGPTITSPFLRLIGREVVSTNAVTWMGWSEATGAEIVAEGALKPEATLTPTEVSQSLDTYAYWKAISRQALEDYPRIRSIVETKLRQGMATRLEAAAVDVLDAVPAPTFAGLGGIRQAIAQLQSAGYAPNGIAVNPADAAALDISVMDGTLNGPVVYGSYWGLPIVPVPGITAGEAFVADFRQAVTWFDRASASVYMSDSHADYFVRNLFVILAEQRSAFALTEPGAIVSVNMAAAPPAGGE